MNVGRVTRILEQLAPPEFAESWDNVGLLIGASDWPAERVLLTIDLTEEVLDEAIADGAQMIVAYHPPIFEPLRSVNDQSAQSRIVLNAARNNIAVYSPHTALDAAPGGVNDWLASGLGAGDVRALQNYADLPQSQQLKLVTFCPATAVDAIRNALVSVGAGHIGAYTHCSFEITGTGTFFGREGATPTIGKAEQLERVDEVRLEMVCPTRSLPLAMTMLRQAHPYEEPLIEIYQLQSRPLRDTGPGRRVVLDQVVTIGDLAERLKKHLGVDHVAVAVPAERDTFHTIGLCAGAGASLLESAVAQGCHVFITGEMRHHSVLDAVARDCAVILAGHTNTERGYLPILMKRLEKQLKGVRITVSSCDRDPLTMM